MYKLNKKGQLIKQRWLKDTEVPGCHDTLKSRKVHRFAQVGFAYCQLFTSESCAPESVLQVMWGGGKYRTATFDLDEPQEKIVKGTEWVLDPEKNVIVRSWSCSYQ